MRRSVVVLAIAALGACGQGDLPRSAAADLQRHVSRIRTAAEDGRPRAALDRLDALLDDAARLLERGVVDEARVLEIVEAAEEVRDGLELLEPATSPSPTVSATAPPEDEGEGEGEGEGHGNEGKGEGQGKGEGKGKGNGEGHGNDD